MEKSTNNQSRRSFLKVTSLTGGGMMIGFSWLANMIPNEAMAKTLASEEWIKITGFIEITSDNKIKLFCPNPEFGTNVMTSLPMLIAEELEVDFNKVQVQMGDYDTPRFKSQFTGGSMAMSMTWKPLRTAGATARMMLLQAAANEWNVPVSELKASKGVITHSTTNRTLSYGAVATAASKLAVPTDIKLKNTNEFSLIGTPQKNKVGKEIVEGHSLFTMDINMRVC